MWSYEGQAFEGGIIDSIEIVGGTDRDGDSQSEEFNSYLRRMMDGELPEGTIYIPHFTDVPDMERLEMGADKHNVRRQTICYMKSEEDLPPTLRLVTNLLRRDDELLRDDRKLTCAAYARLLEERLDIKERRKMGEWALKIAPDCVMDALDEENKRPIKVTPRDTGKSETWTVNQVKADLTDPVKGRLLGESREVYNEADMSRVVYSKPFSAKMKKQYVDEKPYYEYRRVESALQGIMTQWIKDSVNAGIVASHKSAYASPCFLIPKPLDKEVDGS
eukprot:SAG11_NODE_2600_length_3182_cov_3.935777_3_plen_275_part_01